MFKNSPWNEATQSSPLCVFSVWLYTKRSEMVIPSNLVVEEDGPDADLLVKRGHEELSQCVEMVTAVTQRPKPIHAAQPIHSKFWATTDAMDDSEDEDPSTPEFVQLALEAGYSIDELVAAEDALNAGNTSDKLKSAHSIVSNLVNRKITGGAPLQVPSWAALLEIQCRFFQKTLKNNKGEISGIRIRFLR